MNNTRRLAALAVTGILTGSLAACGSTQTAQAPTLHESVPQENGGTAEPEKAKMSCSAGMMGSKPADAGAAATPSKS